MAISKTELVNRSLTLVGANPITSIDDDTRPANIVNRVYEIALRSILSECKWNFATKRNLLAEVDTDLDWYYTNETYIYQRPIDCIRIFDTNDQYATWRLEGNYIISDTQGLGIAYVYYLDDPSKYTSTFIDALCDKLCSDIAYMIVNSTTKAESFLEKYEKVSLPKARAENAQVGTQQLPLDDAWILSKYDNGSLSA